jgi:protocatechuate 3,4-dioxygenase beta subunit
MRPLVVLGLVIVAGATLLFALSSLGGDEPAPVAIGTSPVVATPTPQPGPKTAVRAVEDGPDRSSSPNVAPVRKEVRESLGATHEVFDGSLAGIVTDPEGNPVEGAKLTLLNGATSITLSDIQRVLGTRLDENEETRATTSNAEGRYRFRNLEAGNYTLITKHANFSRREDPMVRVDAQGESLWDVGLEEGLVLQGVVRDQKGNPIRGATLDLNSFLVAALFAQQGGKRNVDPGESATTDAEGRYRFANITPGQWNLTAHAKGFGRETKRNLNLNKTIAPVSIDYELVPGSSVAGRVFSPDRQGIAGALVTVVGYQQPQTLHAEAYTDADGRFEIPDLVDGKYVLMADAEGWGRERVNHVEAPNREVDVEMTEQGSVLGVVVATEGAAPVPSFTASLHQYVAQSGTFGRAIQEKSFQSADGAFTLTGVPEGRYGVQVQAPGFASAYSEDFDVTQGLATTDVVVRLGRGGTIVGLVIDQSSGEPVPGATVMTRDNNFQDNPLMKMFGSAMPRKTSAEKARTDSAGRFEITLLTPELYQIQVTHPSFPDASVNNIRVAEGSPTDVGTIRLVPGSTVRGTVFDKGGDALAGATIQLISTQGDQMLQFEARTGRDGRYILPNIPSGSFKLTATRPTATDDPFRQIIDMKNSEVQISVARGQEYTQDLYLGG